MLWRYGVMALWCYGVMVLWRYGVMALWCYGVMVLWRYGVMAFKEKVQGAGQKNKTRQKTKVKSVE
jgi:hypothetical protein